MPAVETSVIDINTIYTLMGIVGTLGVAGFAYVSVFIAYKVARLESLIIKTSTDLEGKINGGYVSKETMARTELVIERRLTALERYQAKGVMDL